MRSASGAPHFQQSSASAIAQYGAQPRGGEIDELLLDLGQLGGNLARGPGEVLSRRAALAAVGAAPHPFPPVRGEGADSAGGQHSAKVRLAAPRVERAERGDEFLVVQERNAAAEPG